MAVFLLFHHMFKGHRGHALSQFFLKRALIQFMRTPFSWPHYPPITAPPNDSNIYMLLAEISHQHMNIEGHKHSVHRNNFKITYFHHCFIVVISNINQEKWFLAKKMIIYCEFYLLPATKDKNYWLSTQKSYLVSSWWNIAYTCRKKYIFFWSELFLFKDLRIL